MFRKMLINARHPEETRVAIVEDDRLVELEIESDSGRKLKGNIYKARISRIEPSLQAAFIDIGTSRNAFLQINDVHPSYFRAGNSRVSKQHPGRTRIQDVLEQGQELVVQVVKEEREQKGATLTTYLSIPGRYLVLMPGSERGGVSRRINEEERIRLKKLTQELEIPTGIGLIVRTAGLDRSLSELSRDLSILLKLWEGILGAYHKSGEFSLLYQESNLSTSVIRDYFTPEVREVIVDDPETFEKVRQFVDQVMPRYRSRVRLYEDNQPLFSAHDMESQVEATMRAEVKLPSGGAIVIDELEALVAIDVNSGKSTAGGNIEETAYRTNLEAADEISRQLKLRDLGGLVVVDFIDMWDRRHRANLERKMQEAVAGDKARIEVGRLSRFGLLEMSRQRLRATLNSQTFTDCFHCGGRGRFKNPEHVALEALRKIQSAVMAGHLRAVKASLPPGPAFFLLNAKRDELQALEKAHAVRIYVLSDGRLAADDYELELDTSKVETFHETKPHVHDEEEHQAALATTAKPDDHREKVRRKLRAWVHSRKTRKLQAAQA